MTIEELKNTDFKPDEVSRVCNWPYMFKIEFTERSFTLSARTKFEF